MRNHVPVWTSIIFPARVAGCTHACLQKDRCHTEQDQKHHCIHDPCHYPEKLNKRLHEIIQGMEKLKQLNNHFFNHHYKCTYNKANSIITLAS